MKASRCIIQLLLSFIFTTTCSSVVTVVTSLSFSSSSSSSNSRRSSSIGSSRLSRSNNNKNNSNTSNSEKTNNTNNTTKMMQKNVLSTISSSTKNKTHHNPIQPIQPIQPKQQHTLLLCRHGDSIWNGGQPGLKETFTGWTDVPLSQKGIQEASNTGKEVSSYYTYGIDACFTSILGRAKETAHHCLWAFANKPHLTQPQRYVSDYRLNERHYGSLQGFVKHDVENGLTALDYSADQVKRWRRNWHAIPPLLDENDPRRIEEVRKYSNFCGGAENVPRGESLEMVANHRIRPFLDEVLNPIMEESATMRINNNNNNNNHNHNDNNNNQGGGTALVIAHANSLRALIGIICQVENDDVALKRLEAMKIQTGVPLIMRYQKSENGEYQACTIPEIDVESSVGSISSSSSSNGLTTSKLDLPVWPLSCLPKNNKSSGIPTGGSESKKSLDNQPIRIDVI